MAYEKRPYPLIDEIKMHVFTWVADNEWKKLPPTVKEAINIVQNEIKVREVLKNSGLEDERTATDNSPATEKRKYIAIFKQKYLEYYSDKVSMISEYLDNPVVYYYDYGMILNSYSLLVDSIMDYDKDNKTEIDTSYMHDLTSINSCFDIYYYHFGLECCLKRLFY